MSTQERWDVALVVLDGPQASLGEQVLKGPLVRIGANPGPGGLHLKGYRGLDPRQATITAYDGGTVAVSPVGKNQVRVAPHPNVNWRDIDPIRGPEYLSAGSAMHFGPLGRGATVQFIESRRLGVWKEGQMRSEVAPEMASSSHRGQQMAGNRGYGSTVGAGGIPAAYDARKIGKVRTSMIPPWMLGSVVLTVLVTAVLMCAIPVGGIYLNRTVAELGPVEDGPEWFESVDMEAKPALAFKDLEQPIYEFLMVPNMAAAGSNQVGLDDPKNWDGFFIRAITLSVERHVRQRAFFKKLDAKREEWASVLKEMRRAELPEVFAAIPYQESRYEGGRQSFACAKGYWQFMPETAHRVGVQTSIQMRVKNCRLRGRTDTWTPTDLTPPFTKRSPYIEDMECLIDTCLVDDRTDLRRSTKAAIHILGQTYNDPTIRASGSAVQIAILGHNAGYDDGLYGRPKRSNLLPALKIWNKRNGADKGPLFYGQNILCKDHKGRKPCGSLLMPETQHYAYNIVAKHFLAVCYYSKEYSEDPAFAPWSTWALPESYCSNFKIPSKAEVRGF